MILRAALQTRVSARRSAGAHCATTTPSAAVPRCHAPSLPPASSRARAFASSCAVTSDERPSHPPATAKEAATPHTGSSRSTATFLLEQALREEAEEERILQAKKRARQPKELQEPAWDGDEPQARAIRRILEDQYKPLRVKGHIKKIQQPSPLPNSLFADREASPPRVVEDSAPKEPWQVKFKAPASYQTDIRTDNPSSSLPPPISGAPSASARSKGLGRPQRLAQAYERSLDYSAGFRGGSFGAGVMVPVEEGEEAGSEGKQEGRRAMGGMRAWDGIVEDKIRQAQSAGLFKNVKGRGKPLLRDVEAESNPYIKRDDFLINRVIKQQGVAPPWIELQQELELATSAFRQSIRESWIRRATRMQSLGGVTRSAIREVEEGWRDKEWEAQEGSYHKTAVDSINATVRRYNVVAPYTARRGLHSVNAEVAACVKACIPAITWELQRRMDGGRVRDLPERKKGDPGEQAEEEIVEQKAANDRFWPALRRGVLELLGVKSEVAAK